MVEYLLKASVALSLFYAFYFFFMRQDKHFQRNRFYLLFSLVFSLLFPVLNLGWEKSLDAIVPNISSLKGLLPEMEVSSIASSSSTSWAWSTVIYILGLMAWSSHFLWRYIRLLRLIRHNPKENRRGFVLVHLDMPSPIFSFFHYVFWSGKHPAKPEDADRILLHELNHIWDKHSLDILFLEFIKIFFWFHPLVYAYGRSLRLIHEYIADAGVLREVSSKEYLQLIAREVFRPRNPTLIHFFRPSSLSQRLKMMEVPPASPYKHLKLVGIIPLLLLLMLVSHPALFFFRASEYAPLQAESLMVDLENNRFATAEGGLDRFYQEVAQHIKISDELRKKLPEGQVFITFTVETNGTLEDVRVVKSLSPEFDELALAAVQKAKTNWLPAKVEGKLVKQQLSLPIRFKTL